MYDSRQNDYQLSSNPTYEGDVIGVASQHSRAPSTAAVAAVPGAAVRELQKAVQSLRCTPHHQLLGKFALAASDLATLCVAFLIGRMVAWSYHDAAVPATIADWITDQSLLRITVFSAIACAVVMWFWGVLSHYTRRRPYWDEVREVAVVVLFAFMLDAMIVYLGKWQFSRLALGSTWVAAFLLLPLTRLLIRQRLNTLGWFRQPYVIIGRGTEAAETIAALNSEPLMGFEPVAIIAPPGMPRTQDAQQTAPGALPTYQLDDQLLAYLRQPGPLRVVIVLDNGAREAFKALVQSLCLTRDDVFLVPAISGLPLIGMEISHFFSHEVLLLRARNNLNRRAARVSKRIFDLVGASLLLLVLSPLLFVVAAQIRRENGGPVLFSQTRVGNNGRHFPFYKFRSMVTNADQVLEQWKVANPDLYQQYCTNNFKLADDPRVTHVGRWIRRTSIDELPQLWNVLRGDMSLVGPRPIVDAEIEKYGDAYRFYTRVLPGLTGMWQVSGRSDTTYRERTTLDTAYVRNWSVWLDVYLLARTVSVVLSGRGAY